MKSCRGGSLSQDEQSCSIDVSRRTEQQNHNLQSALTEYLIQCIIYVRCVDSGDDWAGRPHKTNRSKAEKIRVKRHHIFTEISRQLNRGEQSSRKWWSLCINMRDTGAMKGRWSGGPVVHQKGAWVEKSGGEAGGESYRVNSWPPWTTPPTSSMDILSAVGSSFRDKQSSVPAAITLVNQWTETTTGLHYTTITLFCVKLFVRCFWLTNHAATCTSTVFVAANTTISDRIYFTHYLRCGLRHPGG